MNARPEHSETASPLEPNQCAALCVRDGAHHGHDVEVLLVTSRDTGRWIIPKGWSRPGKKTHKGATREAWEEAGVRGRVVRRPIGQFRYGKRVETGGAIPCLVQVHLLEVTELAMRFPERHQRRRKWFSPADAAQEVQEPELKALLLGLAPSTPVTP